MGDKKGIGSNVVVPRNEESWRCVDNKLATLFNGYSKYLGEPFLNSYGNYSGSRGATTLFDEYLFLCDNINFFDSKRVLINKLKYKFYKFSGAGYFLK